MDDFAELDFEFPDSKSIAAIRRRVLKWFDKNARPLPWRRSRDPYLIWISEIMLQQTQVQTVIPYFERFVDRFPNVKELATAKESEVLQLWEGLGYYRRARSLHAAAKDIFKNHSGLFPREYEAVLALPGIGRYTAGAILSISQDSKLPILEGNTIRLHSRLLKLADDVKSGRAQRLLWKFAEAILPNKRSGDLNQALMEIGSEICRPKNPDCEKCPLSAICPANRDSLQTMIPASSQTIKYEFKHFALLWVERRNKVLIQKCGEKQWWTGLWDFPRVEFAGAKRSASSKTLPNKIVKQVREYLHNEIGLQAEIEQPVARLKHGVTKFQIQLDCFAIRKPVGRLRSNSGFQWVSAKELDDLPLNATGRKAVKILQKVDD